MPNKAIGGLSDLIAGQTEFLLLIGSSTWLIIIDIVSQALRRVYTFGYGFKNRFIFRQGSQGTEMKQKERKNAVQEQHSRLVKEN